jgi:hypothetical protein
MATPFVSGLAALLYARGLTRSEVRSVIQSSAKDLGAAGYDTVFGYGRIDAGAAIAAAASMPDSGADDVDPSVTGLWLGQTSIHTTRTSKTVWKRISATPYRYFGQTMYPGTYTWHKTTTGTSIRTVKYFRAVDGVVTRRVLTYRKVRQVRTSRSTWITVKAAGTDNVGIDHIGFAVDGVWRSTDWNGSNGWSIQVPCVAGEHAFTAHVWDGAENTVTSQATLAVHC